MKVLSLYDGMSCGYIALRECGLEPTEYTAYEMDKHAIKVSRHNFPTIEHRGEIFPDTDFTEFAGVDFVMGGSPCTHWSIAQSPDKRETTASGLGWELFQHYVRAVEQAKPKYFIYENNKSMSKEIRRSIDEAFGFEATLINSALISAQNRNRLYWVGKRNALGEYDRVKVSQPEDLGILVKDILDGVHKEANHLTDGELDYMFRREGRIDRHTHFASCKSKCVVASIHKGAPYNSLIAPTTICVNAQSGDRYGKRTQPSVYDRIYSDEGKAPAVHTGHKPSVAEPVCVAQRGRYSDSGNRSTKGAGSIEQHYEARTDGKTNTLTTVEKDNYIADPIPGAPQPMVEGNKVYEVKDGRITLTIKGEPRTYDIKLKDGYYIIRKLSVSECARLQTVPDWYDFSPISATQAYKCLGNGWTIRVIQHLIEACMRGEVYVKRAIQQKLF